MDLSNIWDNLDLRIVLIATVVFMVITGFIEDFILKGLNWILRFFIWNLSERWQQEEAQKVLRRINNKKGDKVMTMHTPKATRKDLNSNNTLCQEQKEVKGEPKKVKWKALPESKPSEGQPSLASKFHPKFKIQTQDPSYTDINDVE